MRKESLRIQREPKARVQKVVAADWPLMASVVTWNINLSNSRPEQNGDTVRQTELRKVTACVPFLEQTSYLLWCVGSTPAKQEKNSRKRKK